VVVTSDWSGAGRGLVDIGNPFRAVVWAASGSGWRWLAVVQ